MSVCVIGDPDTVAGLHLAGARGFAVQTAEEAREVLENELSQENCRLLLITRDWADALREDVERLKVESLQPVVFEIPSRDGKMPEPGVAEIVRNAVGIAV